LDVLLDIGAEPMRVVDTFESLYSARIGDNNRIMATGEAIAHLHYLCDTGQMNTIQDKNDVKYYQRA
jgi:hypothetical protein